MFMTSRSNTLLAATVAATAGACGLLAGTSAEAAVIYQDSFNRAGVLNGSTPTVDTGGLGGTANATWAAVEFGTTAADPNWDTSTTAGGQLTYSGNPSGLTYHANAVLPFTPLSGEIYQLQATFIAASPFGSGNSGWAALQFLDTSSGNYASASRPSMIFRADGGGTGFQNGIGGSGTVSGTAATGSYTSDTVVNTMVLNTTGSTWTVAFSWQDLTHPADSVSAAAVPLSSPGSTVNTVDLGFVPGTTGTITNFSLQTVPDPATLGLFAIGGLGLLLLVGRGRTARCGT
jgi:hypothetical protein